MKKRASIGKKILIGVLIVAILLVVVGIAGLIYLNHYLNSPEFLVKIREEAQSQAGVDIELGSLSASIFSGFVLKDIIIASPEPGEKPLIEIGEVTLKYNLPDLLKKRITINRILVNRPSVNLRRNENGEWVLPHPPQKQKKSPPPEKKEAKKKKAGPTGESAWKISVQSIRIVDGVVELRTGGKYDPVVIEEVNIMARIRSLTAPRKIEGKLNISGISFKDNRLVTGLRADLQFEGKGGILATIDAEVADGNVNGDIGIDLKDTAAIPYHAELTLEKVDIPILIKPFRSSEQTTEVTGKIFGQIKAEGNAQVSDSLTAKGDLDIKEGTISENPIQNLLARLMNDDKNIKTITFDQADAEFSFKRMILTLDQLVIHSHKVILTALGTVDYNRDQEMEMRIGVNFQNALVEDIKPKEFRGIFQPSMKYKEYQYFQFKVWGTPDNLENDLAARLVQQGTTSWLKDELFKKDRKKEEDPDLTDEERKKKEEKRKKKEDRLEKGADAIFKLFEK